MAALNTAADTIQLLFFKPTVWGHFKMMHYVTRRLECTRCLGIKTLSVRKSLIYLNPNKTNTTKTAKQETQPSVVLVTAYKSWCQTAPVGVSDVQATTVNTAAMTMILFSSHTETHTSQRRIHLHLPPGFTHRQTPSYCTVSTYIRHAAENTTRVDQNYQPSQEIHSQLSRRRNNEYLTTVSQISSGHVSLLAISYWLHIYTLKLHHIWNAGSFKINISTACMTQHILQQLVRKYYQPSRHCSIATPTAVGWVAWPRLQQ